MNREEFLRQLERLLSGISEEERADAIAFYQSYFEDAGEENEASVIAELESPQKVAESIIRDSGADGAGNRDNESGGNSGNFGYGSDAEHGMMGQQKAPKQNNALRAVGITAVVLTSPIWLTLILVLASIALALAASVFGIAIAIVTVTAALILTGFVLFGCGISSIFGGAAPLGIGLMGAGLIVLALGIAAVLAVIWVLGVFLPWAVKGLWKLCKKPFEKRKERAAV